MIAKQVLGNAVSDLDVLIADDLINKHHHDVIEDCDEVDYKDEAIEQS